MRNWFFKSIEKIEKNLTSGKCCCFWRICASVFLSLHRRVPVAYYIRSTLHVFCNTHLASVWCARKYDCVLNKLFVLPCCEKYFLLNIGAHLLETLQVLKPCVLNEAEVDDFQPMLNSALGIFAQEIFIEGIFAERNFRRKEFSPSEFPQSSPKLSSQPRREVYDNQSKYEHRTTEKQEQN